MSGHPPETRTRVLTCGHSPGPLKHHILIEIPKPDQRVRACNVSTMMVKGYLYLYPLLVRILARHGEIVNAEPWALEPSIM